MAGVSQGWKTQVHLGAIPVFLTNQSRPDLSAMLIGLASYADTGAGDAAGGGGGGDAAGGGAGGAGGAGGGEPLGEGGIKALQAERERNATMARELATLRTQMKALEGRVDPETYAEAKNQAEEYQRKLQEQEQAIARAKADAEATYGPQLKAAHDQRTAAEQALASYRHRTATERLFSSETVKGRAGADNDGTAFFDLFYSQRAASYALDDQGQLYVVDRSGKPVLDPNSGERVDPAKWTREQAKASSVLGVLFEPDQGVGGGFNSSRGPAGGLGQDLMAVSPGQLMSAAFSTGPK